MTHLVSPALIGQIIAINKPKGITSHDVVNTVRRLTGEKRVGHAGTLDPLATGVLVVGIGKQATKLLAQEVQKEKEYITTIRFGQSSTTDDAEGEKVEHPFSGEPPTQAHIDTVLTKFIGEISQIPPIYSAIKVKGTEAYKLARKGKNIELSPRTVLVKKIDVLHYNWPELSLRIITGPGVYIRSLARDIGEMLGVGGYMASLERVRVGQFCIDNAYEISPRSQS